MGFYLGVLGLVNFRLLEFHTVIDGLKLLEIVHRGFPVSGISPSMKLCVILNLFCLKWIIVCECPYVVLFSCVEEIKVKVDGFGCCEDVVLALEYQLNFCF